MRQQGISKQILKKKTDFVHNRGSPFLGGRRVLRLVPGQRSCRWLYYKIVYAREYPYHVNTAGSPLRGILVDGSESVNSYI